MSLNVEERQAVVEFRLEKALRAYEQASGVESVSQLANARVNQLNQS